MTKKIKSRDPNFYDAFKILLGARATSLSDATRVSADIIKKVRKNGDKALIKLTKKFDGLDLTTKDLIVDLNEIDEATSKISPDEYDSLRFAADRITSFHLRQMPENFEYVDDAGIKMGMSWSPIDSVGLYVPGGTASYPSSVLMNAIPARVAGVPRRVIVVPQTRNVINPLVLVAARLSGVEEIYRVGGAQAIAALAYGTETITSVDKIVGPGNSFVAAAKKLVYGAVGIDSIAGPSEILIVADSMNDPKWIAYDLLAQAEHDQLARSILITDNENFAEKVLTSVENILSSLQRSEIARASWENQGAVIIVDSLAEVPELVDLIAPEHLELAVEKPEKMMQQIKHAGAIFLGCYTPEAIGDYVAGPNHVLPTDRTARFSSGLSVFDFIKRTTFVKCDLQGLKKIGPPAITLAQAEGLPAHAESIKVRLNSSG
ncbi:MAG: histidinol dehydrogenase [Pseudomonadota bacterium]|mgnify:FL=1|jgi:histidinol dehydrogenase|nr:histidinol dehydrogenase [Pseudomonadota bacterium]|tara:strand:+ start:2673 stop:3971 length:1299 start_codon:yes stop_codon:yes gene_type:complete